MLQFRLALAGVLALAAIALAPADASALEQRLITAPGGTGVGAGQAVDIDGDTAVVGAPGFGEQQGAVFVFARMGDTWVQTAQLTASDGVIGDALGFAVAIDGDTIVASAINAAVDGKLRRGALYTFSRTGAVVRSETAKLIHQFGDEEDRLGQSVAIDGDVIVATVPGEFVDANGQGGAYTFATSGAPARFETAHLFDHDGDFFEAQFGGSVAIDGDTIAIGQPGGGTGKQGAVQLFTRTGSASRDAIAELKASDGGAADFLGVSVAIDGPVIAAGAIGDKIGVNTLQGSVYTFARTGAASRTQTGKLTASDGAAQDTLGSSVAVAGPTVVAGAPGHSVGSNSRQGAAYKFASTGPATRNETGRLVQSDGAANDNFASRLAVDGPTIIAGSVGDDIGSAVNQGSATVFYDGLPKAAPVPPAAVRAPAISRLSISPKSVRRGKTAKLKFTLAGAAKVRITIARRLKGQRKGKRCVAPKKGRKAKRCFRYKTAKTLSLNGVAGANSVVLQTKRLKVGRYRVTVRATNATGVRSATANLKVLAKKKKRRR